MKARATDSFLTMVKAFLPDNVKVSAKQLQPAQDFDRSQKRLRKLASELEKRAAVEA